MDDILAILSTQELIILTKFDEDWSKNFGIFISIIFLVLYNFFLISLYFKLDLCREREDDFEVQNMFCMKSYIESYRSHQLGGIGNLAIFWNSEEFESTVKDNISIWDNRGEVLLWVGAPNIWLRLK